MSIFLLLFIAAAVYLEELNIEILYVLPGLLVPVGLWAVMSMKKSSLERKMKKFPE